MANIPTAGYTQKYSCLADLPSPFRHHCRWQIYPQQDKHKHTAVWLTYLHHSVITASGKYSHSRLHTNIQLSGWLTFTIPSSLQVANIATAGYTQTYSCLADLPSPFRHHCRWQIYTQQVTHKHTAVWLTYLHHSVITAGGKYSHSRLQLQTTIQLFLWLTFTIPSSLQVANIATAGYTQTYSCLADLPSPFRHHCRWQI